MNTSYAVWLLVSGDVALLVAWLAWRRRTATGALALAALMMAQALWSLTYAVHWVSPTTELRFFWLKMTYFGAAATPVALFVLVQHFIGHGDWLKRGAYVLLSIIPFLTLIFLWTDPLHGLFFGRNYPQDSSMILNGGPWLYVFIFYSYGLIATSVFLLIRMLIRSNQMYGGQARIILGGALLPWFVNFFVLVGWNPLPGLDLTPIAFTGTGLLFAYGFLGYRMMDLVPVARDVLVENMDEAIVVVDMQNRIVDINPKAMEFAKLSGDSLFGKTLDDVFSQWTTLIPNYSTFEGRVEIELDRPPYGTYELRNILLRNRQQHLVGRLTTWRDVSARRKAEAQLRIFFHAVEQNPSMIVITDPAGRIEYVNHQFTRVTGYTLDEVKGKTPRILKSGETPEDLYKMLWETVNRGQTWENDLLNRKKNGELYWARQLIAPVLDENDKVTHLVALQQDITERKHTEAELRVVNTRLQFQLTEIERLHAQLREESIRDGLTRLFNRRYMEETLDREISRADRSTSSISAVMMDVDRFKSINDTFGHQAGDTVLQTLGTLLLENTRVGDIACRYGGDEMVVIMPGASLQDAIHRAEEWRAAFSLLEFNFGDARLRTSLSLGVACFPEHAQTPNELLAAADKALYRAKARRNSVEPYDPLSMAGPNNNNLNESH